MARVPRLVPGCDIKSLPLKPTEAFLLSRIDAIVDERGLSLVTGLSQADVAKALDRLCQLGAIDFEAVARVVQTRALPGADVSAAPQRDRKNPGGLHTENGVRDA